MLHGKWLSWLLPLLLIWQSAGAVDYTLPDLDDKRQSMDQHLGKWVVVNYWATWCGTCREELPDLAAFYMANKDQGVVVVGINFEDIELKSLRQAVAELKIPYPVLRSEAVRHTPLGPVPALPTTYIIDPAGKVIAGEIGLVTKQHLEDYIRQQKLSETLLARKKD